MGQRTLLGILDNNDNYNHYNIHINKSVKQNVPDIKKTFFEHFWDQKWVARPNRPQPQEPPAPFLMTKSVQKMFF